MKNGRQAVRQEGRLGTNKLATTIAYNSTRLSQAVVILQINEHNIQFDKPAFGSTQLGSFTEANERASAIW